MQGLSSDSGFVRIWVIGVTVQGCAWLEAPDVQKVRCSEDAGSHVMNGVHHYISSLPVCVNSYIHTYIRTYIHTYIHTYTCTYTCTFS